LVLVPAVPLVAVPLAVAPLLGGEPDAWAGVLQTAESVSAALVWAVPASVAVAWAALAKVAAASAAVPFAAVAVPPGAVQGQIEPKRLFPSKGERTRG